MGAGPVLQELGLDASCEQVYRALLDEPSMDAGLLAEHLGLSQTQVSQALDALADLALLRMSRAEPGRHHPVSLERGIALLLRRQEEELETRRKALEDRRAAAVVVTATAARQRHRIPAGVELLADIDEIQSRMESLVQAATTEACSIVPAPMSTAALEASRPLDAELADRGVAQKSLCHEAIRGNPASAAYAAWMVDIGAQVRTAPALPNRLLIVDRATAVVPVDPDTPGQGAVLITTPGIVAALAELFDQAWAKAVPFEDGQGHDAATGLSSAESELLRLLATGLTDEAAAKRLGVSVRTIKRRMEDLMRRLEAGSRFEAGAKAAKRGWLK
jgi:sugar-specific transcriptional regulator TrmB/DNA-binding CsgD family transcriptional regulator